MFTPVPASERAKLIFYNAFIDGALDAPRSPSAGSSSAALRARISGVLGPDRVELIECLYQRLQEARSHSTIQGHGQAGRLSRPAAGLTNIGPGPGCTTNFGPGLSPDSRGFLPAWIRQQVSQPRGDVVQVSVEIVP